jgi:replicative DNA helicase
MQDSNLLILAARPGTGKTAMILNIAQYAAVKEKIPVGIFSLEMSKEELVDRLLVSQADIDAWRLKTGKLSDDDFTRLSDAMGELAEAPIYIDDTPGINIMEMRTKARRLQVEHGIKFIIVDYLQLADSGRHFDNRVQEVSVISQNMKNLARELNVPVLVCSQLSRAVEARGTKVPELSDLRESGSIEQDADVVMFLYREEQDQSQWGEQIPTKLRIAKHRNGPLGEIDLIFRGDRIRFFGVDRRETAAQTSTT